MSVWQGVRAHIGETPLWCTERNALYWIDCEGRAVFRQSAAADTLERWDAPSRLGGIVLQPCGGLLVILRTGIFALDADFQELRPIAPPPLESDHLFLHEARCDSQGRLWVGLINSDFINRSGGSTLYRLDGGRLVEQEAAAGGSVANGLAWNRAGTALYFADSVQRTVWRFAFDAASGTLSDKQVFLRLADNDGYPDGATVDADDGYWVAICGGGRVARFNPDGSFDRAIEVPSAFPTAMAFGGPELDRMFVTSIGGKDVLPGFPESPDDGFLFEIDPGARGMPEPLFRG